MMKLLVISVTSDMLENRISDSTTHVTLNTINNVMESNALQN